MLPSKKILYELTKAKTEAPSFAFLPYKAAMWDCMEPLYLECKKCGFIADLIPLNYVTFPDKKLHKESDSFEQNGFEVYGLEALERNSYDYLIIHYPYDGCNNLTKLLPNEYTAVLKRYGKVVYIPYHGNIAGPEWSRFFTMPGARESGFICLGSQQDVDVFKRVNPDYDGIIIQTENTMKWEYAKQHKDDPIPEQYKELKHPVTLICGSLWTFTRDPYERINKHWYVIKGELESGNTVIYRPHPLVYEAIAVMRPEAMQTYQQFLEKVADAVTVLDSSPFLQHAMCVADKLICDPSSVQRSWDGTGKPIEVME